MKYTHLADLHLGSWRDPKMRDLSVQAFLVAMDNCIRDKVDFVLFAGDLFNTSLPALDTLKIVTKKLKELKDNDIPLYAIAGSHDFSPSGKTMIDVLENAGLLRNVCKGSIDPETKQLLLNFTIDPKTGTKLTGILGRRGQLDQTYYQNLSLQNLENESGYKIFMFHTSITEMLASKFEKIESQPVSFLPKGFNYYAGGHIHHPTKLDLPEFGTLTYPGALFPNSFSEVEEYGHGGYYLITVNLTDANSNRLNNYHQDIEWIPLKVKEHHHITINCNHKSPEIILFEIMNPLQNIDVKDALITLRLKGSMDHGKVSDINFKEVFDTLYAKNAYFVMKNTTRLNSEEFEEIKMGEANTENIEEQIIQEHLQQVKMFEKEVEMSLTKTLLISLNTTKNEGETVTDFQKRIEDEGDKILKV
ncbi:exonuclease SbcCD subunit D [Candidatus Woesearchaeota archaeon]|nr:exonuclease SbcCD subunit D [Candidatus Woesearchaeota archaeon]